MLPQHPLNAGLFCCVVGERRGWRGVGGGDRRDLNQLQSELMIFHLDSIYPLSGPVHKYPDIF